MRTKEERISDLNVGIATGWFTTPDGQRMYSTLWKCHLIVGATNGADYELRTHITARTLAHLEEKIWRIWPTCVEIKSTERIGTLYEEKQ